MLAHFDLETPNPGPTSEFPPPTTLHDIMAAERQRLVRLCAYLSGDAQAADDLAQETLLEAWRSAHKLRDPQGAPAWLSAVARNVCLRHRRRVGRDLARQADPGPSLDGAQNLLDALPDDTADLELELDRAELAALLDRALELLPADTRAALVRRFVSESSLAEIAESLGLSEGTVAVRIHRGKLALRRVLGSTLRADAAAHGLFGPGPAWVETRIWCPDCGQHKLLGLLDSQAGSLFLRCPGCFASKGEWYNQSDGLSDIIAGAKGFRTAHNRITAWAHGFYQPGLARGVATCVRCGKAVRPRVRGPLPGECSMFQADASCDTCGPNTQSLYGTLLALPAVRQFWREHGRIRRLPVRQLEAQGVPAVTIGCESVRSSARFEAVFALADFRVLHSSHGT